MKSSTFYMKLSLFNSTLLRLNGVQFNENNQLELFNKCDFGFRLVDLPNIQFLILLHAFVHLIWLVSFGCAFIPNIRNLNGLIIASQFTDDIINAA